MPEHFGISLWDCLQVALAAGAAYVVLYAVFVWPFERDK